MKQVQLRGGARIGLANATFPFAQLNASRSQLELKVTIIGKLTFKPEDIISIEPYTIIPIVGQGIKINHTVSSYKEKVIFWTFRKPRAVIKEIRDTGFLG